MSLQQRLDHALSTALKPDLLQIKNESHQHNVPPKSETHFKVIIVSKQFEHLKRIDRHRLVNSIIKTEFLNKLHALTLSLHTPAEWQQSQKVIPSPACQHAKDV